MADGGLKLRRAQPMSRDDSGFISRACLEIGHREESKLLAWRRYVNERRAICKWLPTTENGVFMGSTAGAS